MAGEQSPPLERIGMPGGNTNSEMNNWRKACLKLSEVISQVTTAGLAVRVETPAWVRRWDVSLCWRNRVRWPHYTAMIAL